MNYYLKLRSFAACLCILAFTVVTVFSSLAPAQTTDFNFKTEVETKNSFLSAAFEVATFQVESESIMGTGLKLDYGYHFNAPFQVDVSFFTAINASETQVSFSGIGSSFYYDLFGNCCETETTTYLGNEKVSVESTKISSSLQVGIGIDQFYLNGTKNVFSASGINAGMAYKFLLFDYNFRVSARYSMMSSNKQKINAYFIGVGLSFPL